VLILLFDRKV